MDQIKIKTDKETLQNFFKYVNLYSGVQFVGGDLGGVLIYFQIERLEQRLASHLWKIRTMPVTKKTTFTIEMADRIALSHLFENTKMPPDLEHIKFQIINKLTLT